MSSIGGISGPSLVQTVTKTLTFTGGAGLGAIGNVPLFTTTGAVHIASIYGYVTVSLGGATATLALGVTGSTALFIGATTATGMTSTNNIWMSTTPTAAGLALPAAAKDILITADIVGTVATAAITAGTLTVTVYYLPVSAGASLVAV